jgi:hypothetical protein
MNFYDLPLSDKISMVNIAVTLWIKGLIKIDPNRIDPEEIVDALFEQAEYLFNKSDLLKKT